MNSPVVLSAAEYLNLKDLDCGFSRWVTIDQDRIDKFADATEDHQFIHVDPSRAAGTAFGGTIAHGALILSIFVGLAEEILPPVENMSMSVNFGFDRIRFVTPVRSGSRIRAYCLVRSVSERAPGILQAAIEARVDIENHQSPALAADWIILTYV